MAYPKFILTLDGHLRLGMVDQHRELLRPGDQCIGGGYYRLDYVSGRMLLDRTSYDFGAPRWHLIDVLRVPSWFRGLRLVYHSDDPLTGDLPLSDTLPIEYCD